MEQLVVALLTGSGTAAIGGIATGIRVAYLRGKAAGRTEATLEALQHAQTQTGRTVDDISARLTRLEDDILTGRARKWRKRES